MREGGARQEKVQWYLATKTLFISETGHCGEVTASRKKRRACPLRLLALKKKRRSFPHEQDLKRGYELVPNIFEIWGPTGSLQGSDPKSRKRLMTQRFETSRVTRRVDGRSKLVILEADVLNTPK